MTKIVRYIGIILLAITLTACGGKKPDKVETPSGMNMQRGRNYKEVIEDFEDKGFTNIRVEKIEDLKYGWVARNGEVEEISVGGDKNYDSGVWVPADTEVVIRYHTFNTKAPEETAEETGTGTGVESAGAGSEPTDKKSGTTASDRNEKQNADQGGKKTLDQDEKKNGTGEQAEEKSDAAENSTQE